MKVILVGNGSSVLDKELGEYIDSEFDLVYRINENINFSPHWPTSGLIAIEFLLQNYDEIYIHGFDSKSKKYEYIHYYDKGDEDRLTEKWHRPRIDHNIELEKKYLNQLRKQKKVIDIV